MKMNAYLNFKDNAREAMNFYAEVLGGKITAMMSFAEGGTGDYVPADAQNNVMHACLEFEGQVLMASDAPGDMYQKPQGTSVCLHPDSVADTERIFAALSEGGEVTMPLANTGWAESYGQLTDRFGTPWMLNYTGNAMEAAQA
ncbi:MAG: VOC family protein [Candidatus Sericytochromatia bacterium]